MLREPYAPVSNQAGFFIVLVASTFLMGSSFVAGKILLQQGFAPMILVGWRFLVAALATLPLVRIGERSFAAALLPAKMGLRDIALVVVIGLLQTAAVMGLLFWAMQSISASNAAILLFTNPIWVAVLGRIFLGENLQRTRLAGLLVGVVGVAFAIGIKPSVLSGGTALSGEIIGLVSALCWASATLINKRAALPLAPWALSFWQMLTGAIAILALAYSNGEHWPNGLTWVQWGWFLWLAIPASTGSFGLWFVALKKGGATRTSGFLFLAPLFTVVLAYFILDAAMSWAQAAGGGLIGLALWLVNRDLPAKSRREPFDKAISGVEP